MEIGLFAESAGMKSLDATLERMTNLGVKRIEMSVGGQDEFPFLDAPKLLQDKHARDELMKKLDAHGVSFSAINASSFPLHPTLGGEHAELIRNAVRLAGQIGVERIVVQSGCPGDGPAAELPNWVAYPWPIDMMDLVSRQWEQVIALWQELDELGKQEGVRKFCFELHPFNLAYNVPTMLKLREAVGESMGVNFDPSHFMWQGMDIPACVRALGPAIFHVHIKDVAMHPQNVALVGVLDNRPDVDFRARPWNFCTPGFGHDAIWWRDFFVALSDVGYDDVASIENEDPYRPGISGVEATVRFLRTILA
jgi:sugar phosphate isomerase/epimerase